MEMHHIPGAYDDDFVSWLEQQAAALRARRLDLLDIDNLIEEIEGAVRKEKHELGSRLQVLIEHLLKCRYQLHWKTRSWRRTIIEQRFRIERLCRASPSLRPLIPVCVAEEYPRAVRLASYETGIAEAVFPSVSPFTVDELLDPAFLP